MNHTEQLADLTARLKQAEAERDAARVEVDDLHQRLRDSSDSRSRLIWRVNHTEAERDAALAKLAEVEKEHSVLRGAVISALGIGQVVGGSKAQLTQLIKNP